MALSQNVALVMVNKYVKFDKNRFKSTEAMAMPEFFQKSIKGDNLIQGAKMASMDGFFCNMFLELIDFQ